MDLELIVTTVIGAVCGGFLFTLIDRIRYKKNDIKRNNEQTKQTILTTEAQETANDVAQIDLGTKFMEQSLSMTKQVQQMMEESNRLRSEQWNRQNTDNNAIITRLDKLDTKVDDLTGRIDIIEGWANGALKAYKNKVSKKK